ncbi:Uncharacterized protein FKW44_023175 [Caligus rogercresseyi]|uniref:Uncharacterized protein n=1 Tax=Caligus rogercresseyi TaxID=217165 RepID=A0A7T8GP62_CALRO|nr:Uncharacterized protein FKW44_023175 [Caligus rogercresseyi]
MKHRAAGRIRFFSDEKIFCVDAKINRQNDRWIASDPEEVPIMEEPSSRPEFMSWRSCLARETSCLLTSLPRAKMSTRRSTWTSCRLW